VIERNPHLAFFQAPVHQGLYLDPVIDLGTRISGKAPEWNESAAASVAGWIERRPTNHREVHPASLPFGRRRSLLGHTVPADGLALLAAGLRQDLPGPRRGYRVPDV
jgi:hypothetical protein